MNVEIGPSRSGYEAVPNLDEKFIDLGRLAPFVFPLLHANCAGAIFIPVIGLEHHFLPPLHVDGKKTWLGGTGPYL